MKSVGPFSDTTAILANAVCCAAVSRNGVTSDVCTGLSTGSNVERTETQQERGDCQLPRHGHLHPTPRRFADVRPVDYLPGARRSCSTFSINVTRASPSARRSTIQNSLPLTVVNCLPLVGSSSVRPAGGLKTGRGVPLVSSPLPLTAIGTPTISLFCTSHSSSLLGLHCKYSIRSPLTCTRRDNRGNGVTRQRRVRGGQPGTRGCGRSVRARCVAAMESARQFVAPLLRHHLLTPTGSRMRLPNRPETTPTGRLASTSDFLRRRRARPGVASGHR